MSEADEGQELRELNLTRISDYFSDEHIALIAQQLRNLEDLYIGGYGVSDAVFPHLTELRNLKVVTFSGITSFTEAGILDFVDPLGEVRPKHGKQEGYTTSPCHLLCLVAAYICTNI